MILDDGINVTSGRSAASRDDTSDLSELNVVELKDRLRARDLPVSGNKDELIDRLRDAGE